MSNDPYENSTPQPKPDFALAARIKTSHGVVENVPCYVHLPRTVMENPHVRFEPNKEQSDNLIVPSFSFEARDIWDRETTVEVRSKTVWASGPTTRRYNSGNAEYSLDGNPWDLEVTQYFPSREPNEGIRNCIFWLTPNMLLSPAVIHELSYTGEAKVKTARETSLTLSSTSLTFRKHFRYEEKPVGTLSHSELVAEAHGTLETGSLESVVDQLDDGLLLTSVATRRRCVCRGWQYMEGGRFRRFYRSRLIAPKLKPISVQETLIDVPYFQEFLAQTLPVFRRAQDIARLRYAMYALLSANDGDIETQFLRLFTALETLVSHGCETIGFGPILDDTQWKPFKRDLKKFIKRAPPLDGNPELTHLMFEKVGELNRASFASSFQRLTEAFRKEGFALSDLWPITGSQDGVSLTWIRNRLVHGHFYKDNETEPLLFATYHLRWYVERIILAMLKWPVKKSLVGEFLRNLHPYNQWRPAQAAFSKP